ncbi:MAG: hypothetical protein FWC81_03145 [Coriobacteriia bacterium]|nr:hypothetical protein [Coriobacteriia bacterium]
MPYEMVFGFGPVWFALFISAQLVLFSALLIFIDSLRPKRKEIERTFDTPVEGVTCYTIFAGILVIIGLIALPIRHLPDWGNFERVKDWIEFIGFFNPIFISLLIFVYLKRVVFNPVTKRFNAEIRRQRKLKRAGRELGDDADGSVQSGHDDSSNKQEDK